MAGNFFRVAMLLLVAVIAMTFAATPSPMESVCLHPKLPCPSSYMPGNFLTTDLDDPCGYCQCIWGRPIKKYCARYLQWNDMYKQCIPAPPSAGCESDPPSGV